MKTDRELLELAAKAYGLDHDGLDHPANGDGRLWDPKNFCWWDPQFHDGDALRLAVKARVFLDGELRDRFAYLYWAELVNHSPEEATRRSIIRVVAESQEDKDEQCQA